jgi:hypothetical protein
LTAELPALAPPCAELPPAPPALSSFAEHAVEHASTSRQALDRFRSMVSSFSPELTSEQTIGAH